jgi:hypothetical protein
MIPYKKKKKKKKKGTGRKEGRKEKKQVKCYIFSPALNVFFVIIINVECV